MIWSSPKELLRRNGNLPARREVWSMGLAIRQRERRQEIARELIVFFSCKVTILYALAEENPELSADSRTAEVFEIYSRAGREVEDDVHNPLRVRGTIERGVFLADKVLEAYGVREG